MPCMHAYQLEEIAIKKANNVSSALLALPSRTTGGTTQVLDGGNERQQILSFSVCFLLAVDSLPLARIAAGR